MKQKAGGLASPIQSHFFGAFPQPSAPFADVAARAAGQAAAGGTSVRSAEGTAH